MKIEFRWKEENGHLYPFCSTKDVSRNTQILTDLLNDDGGLGISTTLEWLLEGIRRIDLVKSHQVDSLKWDRETFGAFISSENVEIYSLYVETYRENRSFQSFEGALLAWVAFIRSTPSVDLIVEMEV